MKQTNKQSENDNYTRHVEWLLLNPYQIYSHYAGSIGIFGPMFGLSRESPCPGIYLRAKCGFPYEDYFPASLDKNLRSVLEGLPSIGSVSIDNINSIIGQNELYAFKLHVNTTWNNRSVLEAFATCQRLTDKYWDRKPLDIAGIS